MGVEARPKEGAGGLTVTQVPRPGEGGQGTCTRGKVSGVDWGGLGASGEWGWVLSGSWFVSPTRSQPTTRLSCTVGVWMGPGEGRDSLSPVIHGGYWGENRRQHPLKADAPGWAQGLVQSN